MNDFKITLPNMLLRLEGLTVFIGATVAYAYLHGSGWLFVVLLLVPDVSMIGYLQNTRTGAFTYNLVHVYTAPILLLAFALTTQAMLPTLIALIWIAHIGMDRVAGYGLKYTTDFKETHMERV